MIAQRVMAQRVAGVENGKVGRKSEDAKGMAGAATAAAAVDRHTRSEDIATD
jgi:hypothetical protein